MGMQEGRQILLRRVGRFEIVLRRVTGYKFGLPAAVECGDCGVCGNANARGSRIAIGSGEAETRRNASSKVNSFLKLSLKINPLSATVRRLASLRDEVRGEGWGEVHGRLKVTGTDCLRQWSVQMQFRSQGVCICLDTRY